MHKVAVFSSEDVELLRPKHSPTCRSLRFAQQANAVERTHDPRKSPICGDDWPPSLPFAKSPDRTGELPGCRAVLQLPVDRPAGSYDDDITLVAYPQE